jgi:hypothetical protein
MSHNEKFVATLFSQMMKCKPTLARFLPDESALLQGEEMDHRELSNIITKEFPWPIGIELRRLLSGSMALLNRGRLDQTLKTYERTLQFVAFILVINLYEEQKKNNVALPEGFKIEFNKRFRILTLGNYVWLIHSIGNIFKKQNMELFLPELKELFSKPCIRNANLMVQDRNDLSHYLVNLTDDDIELKCVESFEKLGELLGELAFLINYPLVTIPQIYVKKNRSAPVNFEHHMLMLNSASSSFYGTTRIFDRFTDTPSVLLIKNTKEIPTESLNLSPLIIDSHFETIDSPEKKLKIKKDVLLYSKYDAGQSLISYAGTESIEKPDATFLSFYETLKEEFQDIYQTLSN